MTTFKTSKSKLENDLGNLTPSEMSLEGQFVSENIKKFKTIEKIVFDQPLIPIEVVGTDYNDKPLKTSRFLIG